MNYLDLFEESADSLYNSFSNCSDLVLEFSSISQWSRHSS